MINPYGMSFIYWASTLTQDFPNDTIPIIADESQWRDWGNIVAGSTTFARAGVPRTESFSASLEWTERLYELLG